MPAPVMIPDNHRARSYFPIRMPGRPEIASWAELEALRLADIARFQAIAERDMAARRSDPSAIDRAEREARRKAEAEEDFRHYLDGLEPDPDDVHVDEEPEVEPED